MEENMEDLAKQIDVVSGKIRELAGTIDPGGRGPRSRALNSIATTLDIAALALRGLGTG